MSLKEVLEEYPLKQDVFTEAGIKNIVAFADSLKRIHVRLIISKGYSVKDGLMIKPANVLLANTKNDTI